MAPSRGQRWYCFNKTGSAALQTSSCCLRFWFQVSISGYSTSHYQTFNLKGDLIKSFVGLVSEGTLQKSVGRFRINRLDDKNSKAHQNIRCLEGLFVMNLKSDEDIRSDLKKAGERSDPVFIKE
ncbi:hypothetical protein XENOCAPTIV_001563 [Xenoophorus captivus]|uniref:Uncharacterized protein n=1 Tax=Xenoophorus captivus TaxID=1517983 RepID=A0ABV0Q4A9_9TELE